MNRGENKRSGLAIAGLVLGIMGLVISAVPNMMPLLKNTAKNYQMGRMPQFTKHFWPTRATGQSKEGKTLI